jgi:ribonuclease E
METESADAPAANDAPVADVNVASSEALSAAFSSETQEHIAENQDEASAPQAAESPSESAAHSASAKSEATADAQQLEKASAVETPVSARAPEVVVTTTSANAVDAVEKAVEEVDTSGLTAEGRAVNDPRILPKPVTDTAVQTELTQLFTASEAPPVSVVPQNIPRASNDPRGPKAASAGK